MEESIHIETAGQSTYAPSWDAVVKLNAKIANLMHSIGPVQKDARNAHFKYEYTSYEAMAAAVRAAIVSVGLSFTVGTGQIITEGNNRTVELEACFADTETGAMRLVRWAGEGTDNQDKATAKAITSGVKYLFLRNLLISTNEDVDPDRDGPAADATSGGNGHKEPAERPERPADAATVIGWLQLGARKHLKAHPEHGNIANDKRRGGTVGALDQLFTFRGANKEAATLKRHALLKTVYGTDTSKTLTDAQCTTLLKWACAKADDGQWVPNGDAATEAARIVEYHDVQQGQTRMEGV